MWKIKLENNEFAAKWFDTIKIVPTNNKSWVYFEVQWSCRQYIDLDTYRYWQVVSEWETSHQQHDGHFRQYKYIYWSIFT